MLLLNSKMSPPVFPARPLSQLDKQRHALTLSPCPLKYPAAHVILFEFRMRGTHR